MGRDTLFLTEEVNTMKRIIAVLIAMGLTLVQVPVFGATMVGGAGKDACLLNSQNCPCQMMSLQQKIARLNAEIGKGTKVYTPDELRKLGNKLYEAELMLDTILYRHNTMPLY
jgi:hypothetical protein